MPTNRRISALCAVAICAALWSGTALARVRPDSDRSALSASVLRNIDADYPHWGASAGANRVILHATAARFRDGPGDLIGFAGLDFMRGDRWVFSLEMNVNQDFRYHYLDLRLRRFW